MNPKPTANLDPKLKEAYERIMGTTVPQPQAGQPTAPSQEPINSASPKAPEEPNLPPPPTAHEPMMNVPKPHPLQPEAPKLQVEEVTHEPINISTPDIPPPPVLEPLSGEMVQSPESPIFNSKKNPFIEQSPGSASNMIKNVQENNPKKKGGFMRVLLSLGGLIFFILYGVIWAKVFGLF